MKLINPLLSQSGVQAQIGRSSYWDSHTYGIRTSNRRGKPEAGLWFRTRGCLYDRSGGCVMCDYGSGPDSTTSDQMISYVQAGLLELHPNLYHLLVSPIGSFLDEWEVPEKARVGILKLLALTDHETFSFETRAETVSEDKIEQVFSLIKRELKIYMGLESANPWISKYCLNKGLSQAKFQKAINILNRHQIKAVANILIGTPFLSVSEIIDDALYSVSWALSNGVNECNLFPVHVKDWTALLWLFKQDLYHPPSLWTYIEVIRRLGPEIACQKLELSWYKTYGSINVHKQPSTCSLCENIVIEYLDRFDETNDYEWIQKLVDYKCICKDDWWIDLDKKPEIPSLAERVATFYELIGQRMLGSDWWLPRREKILKELFDDAEFLTQAKNHNTA